MGYGSKVGPRAVKSVAISCELRALAKKRGYELRAVSCGSYVGRELLAVAARCDCEGGAVAPRWGHER